MKKHDLNLDALRIEGSLLPAEFVQKLLELKADRQSATDYGVPPGLNLKDEIGRYQPFGTARNPDAVPNPLAPYRPPKSQEVLRRGASETGFRASSPAAQSGAHSKSSAWCGALCAF